MREDTRIGLIKSPAENTYVKTCSASSPTPQSTEGLISHLHPELLSGGLKVSSCSSTWFNPCRWQVPICSWQWRRFLPVSKMWKQPLGATLACPRHGDPAHLHAILWSWVPPIHTGCAAQRGQQAKRNLPHCPCCLVAESKPQTHISSGIGGPWEVFSAALNKVDVLASGPVCISRLELPSRDVLPWLVQV